MGYLYLFYFILFFYCGLCNNKLRNVGYKKLYWSEIGESIHNSKRVKTLGHFRVPKTLACTDALTLKTFTFQRLSLSQFSTVSTVTFKAWMCNHCPRNEYHNYKVVVVVVVVYAQPGACLPSGNKSARAYEWFGRYNIYFLRRDVLANSGKEPLIFLWSITS